MFIKLLKNRKKLRKAAETQSWPSDKEEDEDDEYEVGEKRKKTENDWTLGYKDELELQRRTKWICQNN